MNKSSRIALFLCSVVGTGAGQTVIDETKLIRPAQSAQLPAAQSAGAQSQLLATPPASYTIPAGTTILARLSSPLHTTSATVGSGVYLDTMIPVVVGDHVVVPANSSILGTIEYDQRPGRSHGRAQFRFQFHTLILPNNHCVTIAGSLQGLPGSSIHRRTDARGTAEPVDQIDRDVRTMVKGTMAGAGMGFFIGRSPSTTVVGTAAGGAAALAQMLFTRGDEIRLPVGTTVELVLDRPATVASQYVP